MKPVKLTNIIKGFQTLLKITRISKPKQADKYCFTSKAMDERKKQKL